jgi:glyoxylase-like metal-dependent hydrolase (beta-lactamase superfamily II)
MPLPTRPGHVHLYLLRDGDGWTLVDAGMFVPGTEQRLEELVKGLDAPVTRLLVTHMHPDHVGAAGPAAELTGAEVLQGELDYAQCEHVWGNPEWPARIAGWFRRNGVPADVADELLAVGSTFRRFIRYARDPTPLAEGDRVGDWEAIALPGHSDGQLGLIRDGVLVAADHILPDISPAVGLYPDARPDPLGDFLASLERTIALAPRLALPGHGEPVEDPAGRARKLIRHHENRLTATEEALGGRPLTGYEVSLALFGAELAPQQRRFAVAETLSHLERLVREERAQRHEDDGSIAYTGR